MSNEVRIGVTGTNDSGRAINAAKTDIKALGEEAQKSARKFVELGVSEERAATEAGKMSRKIDQLGDDAGQLARKMLEAQVATKIAAEQIARYGDKDSLDNLRKAKKEFSELSDVAKHFGTIGHGGKSSNLFDDLFKDAPKAAEQAGKDAGQIFSGGFFNSISNLFEALPPQAQAALAASLAAVAVAAVPFIVSAVDGAILAGVGGGGLAAGIAVQAKDPQVSAAFKNLGAQIMGDLQKDTAPFKAQLLTVAADFGKSWTKIQPNIAGFFDKIAPATSKLGAAIGKAVEVIGPALEKAAPAAEKVLSAIASEIPEIAQQIANLLDDIGAHGDSAAEAIKFILFNVEALIGGFDIMVKTIGPAADTLVHIAQGLGLIDPSPIQGTAHELSHLEDSARGAAGAVYNTADAADAANAAFGRLFGEMMSVDEANLKVAEDFRKLRDDLRKNKDSIDANTEGGQANRRMILGMISDLEAKREADIAAGNGTIEATKKANAAYLAQLQRLRDVAVAAGQPTAAIDGLINKYKQLAGLPDITKNVNIIHTDTYRTNGTPQAGHARYPGEAHGGIVGAIPFGGYAAAGGMRNGLTKVGESGWEYVELPPGSRVYPHGESMRMESSSGGGMALVITWDLRGNDNDYLYETVKKGLNDRKITVRQSNVVAG